MLIEEEEKDVKFYLINNPLIRQWFYFYKVGEQMKKINILKNSRDFDRIIKGNKPYKFKDYIIYIERNTNDLYKFGLSVGKKIGNAVNRNKVKRQLKSIIDKKDYQNNFNCIIIVGKGINERNFEEREKNLLIALSNLNIIKETQNEKK